MKAKEYYKWFQEKEKEVGEKRAFVPLILQFMDEVGKSSNSETNPESARS